MTAPFQERRPRDGMGCSAYNNGKRCCVSAMRCYQRSDAGATDRLRGVSGWRGAGPAGEVASREEALAVARPDCGRRWRRRVHHM